MSAHQFSVSVEDLGGLIKTAVFIQYFKEVLGQSVHIASLGEKSLDTISLGLTGDSGVFKEGLNSLVLADEVLELSKIAFNGIKRVLTNSSGIKSSSVTTIKTEKSDRRLRMGGSMRVVHGHVALSICIHIYISRFLPWEQRQQHSHEPTRNKEISYHRRK